MREKRNALPVGGTTERAAETSTESSAFSESDFIIEAASRQGFCVADFLLHGEANAVPASLLAALAGFRSTRSLRLQIERERQAGTLILASDAGYYLPSESPAEAAAEVRRFVARCDRRMVSNRLSVRSCKRFLKSAQTHEVAGQVRLGEKVE